MKGLVDVLVCWTVNSPVEDGIEVLELSKILNTKTRRVYTHRLKGKYQRRKLWPTEQFLMVVFERGSVARPEVYRLVDARPVSITLMMDRLEKRGWIKVAQQIGRIRYYTLTEAGRDRILAKYFWTRVREEKVVLGA